MTNARRTGSEHPDGRVTVVGPRVGRLVGRCDACGVTFVARRGEDTAVREARRVHERVCPGGERGGELVWPVAALDRETSPVVSRRDARRISCAVWLLAALCQAACTPSPGPADPGALAAIGSTRVRATVAQDRIVAQAETPQGTPTSVGPGGGMLLSGLTMVASAAAEGQRKSTADGLLGTMWAGMAGFDFRAEMLERLRVAAPDLRRLEVKRVDASAAPLTEAERTALVAEGPESALLTLASRYELSSRLRTLTVATTAELWSRGERRPVYVGRYEYWTPPVDSCETMEACAKAWSADQALPLRTALREGIAETLRMLAIDLGRAGSGSGGPTPNLSVGPLAAQQSFPSYVASEGTRYVVRRPGGGLLSASSDDVLVVPRGESR